MSESFYQSQVASGEETLLFYIITLAISIYLCKAIR